MLLALLLFPAVVLAALRLAQHRWRWPLAAVPLYGLVLIHYSMLHLAAAFLGAWLAVGLATGRAGWREALRLAVVGLLAAGLMVVLNGEALADPRAGGFAFDPLGGLSRVVETFLAARPGFVIFMDRDFGLAPSPFRGVLLLACAAVCVAAAVLVRRRSLGAAAAVYLLAFVASLAMAYGVVPAGISPDFMRWFAWPLQAALFLSTGLALLTLAARAPRPVRILAMVAVGAAGAAVLYRDGRAERATFQATAAPRADLSRMDAILPDRPPSGGCLLIGESDADPASLITFQRSRVWTYAEVVSPCRYLNGSWVHPGDPAGRAISGMPAAEVLRTLP